MAKTSLSDIAKYLLPFAKYEGIQLDPCSVPARSSVTIPSTSELATGLVERWKSTPYFTREGRPKEPLFDRLQSRNVLDAVLAEQTLDEIRCVLQVFEIEEQQRTLTTQNRSSYGYPVQFHRSLLLAIYGHIKEVRKLIQAYRVNEKWLASYFEGAHKQMVLELRRIFPLYPFKGTSYRPTMINDSLDDIVCSLYDSLEQALKMGGFGRGGKELAIQLVGSICSPSEFFHGDSSMTFDAIRKRLERRSRLRTKRKR